MIKGYGLLSARVDGIANRGCVTAAAPTLNCRLIFLAALICFFMPQSHVIAKELVPDQWIAWCITDEMTDERNCSVQYAHAFIEDPNFLQNIKVLQVAFKHEVVDGELVWVLAVSFIEAPKKVGVRVDKNKPVYTELCTATTCLWVDADDIVQQFKSGNSALVRLEGLSNGTLDYRLSLIGFTAALNEYLTEMK